MQVDALQVEGKSNEEEEESSEGERLNTVARRTSEA
jgi:hypothetical protein